MSKPKGSIPEWWIKEYVDQLISVAESFGDSAMGRAAVERGNHIMDMVKAYRERNQPATQPAEGEGEGG